MRFFLFSLLWVSSTLLSVPYTARVTGDMDASLRAAMEKDSLTISAAEKETPSRNALRLRALNDIDRLNAVAVYHGYYDCRINPIVTDSPTLNVDFAIALGAQFSFGTLTIEWNDEDLVRDDLIPRSQEALAKGPMPSDVPSFSSDSPATGKAILDIDSSLIKALRARAFAFAKIVSKTVQAGLFE